jgi:hypothetical protein
MKTLALLSTTALLLLASAETANAESLATGCLNRSGQIYNLGMYSNNPSTACKRGDQTIRLAVHQPDTKFSKQRTSFPFESGATMATFLNTDPDGNQLPVEVQADYSSCAIGCDFGTSAPPKSCELYLFWDEIVYLIASVPDGSTQDGISSVTIFNHDGRDFSTTIPTTKVVLVNSQFAVVVYDLHVEAGPGGCSVSYMMEFADDPAMLYSR